MSKKSILLKAAMGIYRIKSAANYSDFSPIIHNYQDYRPDDASEYWNTPFTEYLKGRINDSDNILEYSNSVYSDEDKKRVQKLRRHPYRASILKGIIKKKLYKDYDQQLADFYSKLNNEASLAATADLVGLSPFSIDTDTLKAMAKAKATTVPNTSLDYAATDWYDNLSNNMNNRIIPEELMTDAQSQIARIKNKIKGRKQLHFSKIPKEDGFLEDNAYFATTEDPKNIKDLKQLIDNAKQSEGWWRYEKPKKGWLW